MAKKRVSIKDIAEIIGVTPPTVSRALRGQGRMSDKTRTRIMAVAEEVGYTPSLMARGLVMQRSFCIGLIVPTFADPYHSEVAQGLEEEARRYGYSLFLASTDVDPEREREVARGFHGRAVDGIVVSASRIGNGYSQLIEETGIPVVIVTSMAESDQIPTIVHDDYQGMRRLMQHLIKNGHRRIAYMGNSRGGLPSIERERAWRDSMIASGLSPELVVHAPNGRIEGGVLAAEELLEMAERLWQQPPHAVACYNDTMAIGLMAVLRQNGLRIPEDVAVTGFDDLDLAAVIDPPLTTIHQPRAEMGARAMQLLLLLMGIERPDAQPDFPSEIRMVGDLIMRRSA